MNPLNEIEWSQRAKNCLASCGITTMQQPVTISGEQLQSGRNVGVTTLRELLRGCVQFGYAPRWVREVRMNFTGFIEPECPPDMEILAGPYADSERWQLDLAIAQLNVPWCVVATCDGYLLCRDRKGWEEVEPEEI